MAEPERAEPTPPADDWPCPLDAEQQAAYHDWLDGRPPAEPWPLDPAEIVAANEAWMAAWPWN